MVGQSNMTTIGANAGDIDAAAYWVGQFHESRRRLQRQAQSVSAIETVSLPDGSCAVIVVSGAYLQCRRLTSV